MKEGVQAGKNKAEISDLQEMWKISHILPVCFLLNSNIICCSTEKNVDHLLCHFSNQPFSLLSCLFDSKGNEMFYLM